MDDRPISLAELARAPRPIAEVGGKASNLARLLAAGLPVPPGVVVAAGAERSPAALAAALAPALAELGDLLAVRSSAAVEDGHLGSAAGLFASRAPVRGGELADAIAEVVASAGSPAVAAYLERRGAVAAPAGMAVIVQRWIAGRASGVVYTRSPDPAHGGGALVEVEHGDVAHHAVVGGPAAGEPAIDAAGSAPVPSPGADADDGAPLSAAELVALVDLARRAAAAIGEPEADVEWVLGDGGFVLVQARPIAAVPAAAPPLERFGWTRGDASITWRWDADHNPDPLSPAQIGLVERMAPWAPNPMRVVDGYLYYGRADRRPPPDDGPAPDAAGLATLFTGEIVPAIDRALADVERVPNPELVAALGAYDEVWRIYTARLSPAVARARAALPTGAGKTGPSELYRALARCAAGAMTWRQLAALAAPLSPAWDVAAPTYAEAPDLLRRALERMGEGGAPPLAAGHDLASEVLAEAATPGGGDLAAVVAAIGEADDRLLYRAQAVVRRALLRTGGELGLVPVDDVFYLPLAELALLAARGVREGSVAFDRGDLRRRAGAARALRAAQRREATPLAVRAGRPLARRGRPGADGLYRGRGFGAAVRGRIARADDLGRLELSAERTIVVARALTPPMVALVAGAAAVVSERGGLLGHAAAIARELGLTCVVGCSGAWSGLTDGDEVLVDGFAGLVVRLSGGLTGG